jgi:SAM-dependent methyltransferase
MALPPNVRTPLRHVQGEIEMRGDPELARRLADAFRIREDEAEDPIRGVHGLHPYPGRLHPAWVRRLLRGLHGRARVLDPFCGSGTVMVEAMLSGREAFGSDLNEVALRIARQRIACRDQGFLESFARLATSIHDDAAERRETPFSRLAGGEKRFPPHVLTQLINLRAAIDRHAPDGELGEALLIAMSPLLSKFAERKGRAAPQVGRRAVRDAFLTRAEGMVEAWADFAERLPSDAVPAELRKADARNTSWLDHRADAIITSPPYPGVYDYAGEQELRAKWLGRAGWVEHARRNEIGRRGDRDPRSWVSGMRAALKEMVRITTPGAWIFLVVGDGTVRREPVRTEQVIRTLIYGGTLHLRRLAAVSMNRPHFHTPSQGAFQRQPRREHLILLERP